MFLGRIFPMPHARPFAVTTQFCLSSGSGPHPRKRTMTTPSLRMTWIIWKREGGIVDKLQPNRRTFIKYLTLLLSAIGIRPRSVLAGTTEVSFHVAGARFHALRHTPAIGD